MGFWPVHHDSWWETQGPIEASSFLSRGAARRSSLLTRYCAKVIEGALNGDTLDENMPIIFGSVLGSISVLFELLQQIASEDAGLSPIRFSGSVHHAPVAAISVSVKHKGFMTAISANHDLCAMALIETLSVAQNEGRALMVLGDEKWPEAFNEAPFDTYAGAVLFEENPDRALSIRRSKNVFSPQNLPSQLRANPSANLQLILDWSQSATPGDSIVFAPHFSGGSWEAICS